MLVVDANIIFSCFNRKSYTRRLLGVIGEKTYLVAPALLFEEISEHKEEIFGFSDELETQGDSEQ